VEKLKIAFILIWILSSSYVVWGIMTIKNSLVPNEPYEAVLNLDGDGTKYHVSLREVKRDTALISVEDERTVLLEEGEVHTLGTNGSALVGNHFEGSVRVQEIKGDTVTLMVDIQKQTGYYLFYGMVSSVLGGLIAGVFLYAVFVFITFIRRGSSWRNQNSSPY
jgi:hypothetical protein